MKNTTEKVAAVWPVESNSGTSLASPSLSSPKTSLFIAADSITSPVGIDAKASLEGIDFLEVMVKDSPKIELRSL